MKGFASALLLIPLLHGGLSGQPVLASTPLDSASNLLDQASSRYADLDFEAALAFLNQALQIKGNSREQLVRIYYLRGVTYGALTQYAMAREDFSRLLSLEPTFRLGSEMAPRMLDMSASHENGRVRNSSGESM